MIKYRIPSVKITVVLNNSIKTFNYILMTFFIILSKILIYIKIVSIVACNN